MFARKASLVLAMSSGALTVAISAQAPADIESVMAKVGDRVAQYYKRIQNLICTEKSTVQSIGFDMSPIGFARTVESEMRVETDGQDDSSAPAEARVRRELRKVNGRVPREHDTKNRAGCTDPNPLSPEPLAFLLPGNQRDYRFSGAKPGKEKNRPALQIEFTEVNKNPGTLELIEDPRGHDDCYEWKGSLAIRGRLWVDAASFEVLRVEQRLASQGEMKVSSARQIKHNFPGSIALDRYDMTIRYKTVTFTDPEETLLLPESIDTLTVVRRPLQSNRSRQEYSDYRRFLTGGRVVK